MRQIKEERGCQRCGTRTDLHFHHRDPATKTRKVAYMVRWGTERLLAEIAKCDVLCVTCHADHHWPNRAGAAPNVHGCASGRAGRR